MRLMSVTLCICCNCYSCHNLTTQLIPKHIIHTEITSSHLLASSYQFSLIIILLLIHAFTNYNQRMPLTNNEARSLFLYKLCKIVTRQKQYDYIKQLGRFLFTYITNAHRIIMVVIKQSQPPSGDNMNIPCSTMHILLFITSIFYFFS